MSAQDSIEPSCQLLNGQIELIVSPKEKDIGNFSVRRVLPSPERRMVGPFVFFDHMGPATLPPGKGIQVRPHPHIGIATITYLFSGEILHSDSLGFRQVIRPGAVNLMTAGQGITHAERAADDLHELSQLHGIQSWIALPEHEEEREPAFVHYPGEQLPEINIGDAEIKVLMGEIAGAGSPVSAYSPTLYLDCRLPAGGHLTLPDDARERALYIVSGEVEAAGTRLSSCRMGVSGPAGPLDIVARADSRFMVLGGDPLGKRHIWWNFVSSRRERIEQAKADWQAGRFDPVPGDSEFIPLPD